MNPLRTLKHFRLAKQATFAMLTIVPLAILHDSNAQDATPSLQQSCPGITATYDVSYEVDCEASSIAASQCKVDSGTYAGGQTFGSHCAECHGEFAVAIPGAPDLLSSLSTSFSYDEFTFVLFHGRGHGSKVMPAWQRNCNVVDDIDNLYRYLKARADGALPPGKPEELRRDSKDLLPPFAEYIRPYVQRVTMNEVSKSKHQ